MIEIKHRFNGNVLFAFETDSIKVCLQMAIETGADLQEADLQGANLRWANLRGADLQRADLQEADLQEADLQGANLRWADLRGANLRWADLQEADLNFSCWGLSCKTFNVKVDDKLVTQLLHHVAKLNVSECSSVVKYAHKLIFSQWPGKWLANKFCEYRNDVNEI